MVHGAYNIKFRLFIVDSLNTLTVNMTFPRFIYGLRRVM